MAPESGACQGHEPNTSVYALRNDRGQCMTCVQRRGGAGCRSARKSARLRWPQGELRNGPSLHTEGIQRVSVWHFSQQHTGRSVGRVFTAKINTVHNTKLSFRTRNSINPISRLLHRRQLHAPVPTVDMRYREHCTIIWILVQNLLKRGYYMFCIWHFYCSFFVCNI